MVDAVGGLDTLEWSAEARKQLGLDGDVKGVVVATVEPGSSAWPRSSSAGGPASQAPARGPTAP